MPSSGIVGSSGTPAVPDSVAFLSFDFTVGAGATMTAFGGTHDIVARATASSTQVVIFEMIMIDSRNATPQETRLQSPAQGRSACEHGLRCGKRSATPPWMNLWQQSAFYSGSSKERKRPSRPYRHVGRLQRELERNNLVKVASLLLDGACHGSYPIASRHLSNPSEALSIVSTETGLSVSVVSTRST